jgi:hypothetical protein
MFHLFFLDVCCKCFYLGFTYILQVFLSGCCICFTMAFQVFSGAFASVSDVCFKCFIYIDTYVTNVSSGCFRSSSSVVLVVT